MQAETSTVPKTGMHTAGPVEEHVAGSQPLEPPVGYKQPPAQHRFKKGCSGNPNGRPRKHPVKDEWCLENDVEKVLLKEAYRPVSIREGDKVIKLPAVQAAMRGLVVSAIKGDRRAQLALRELTETVEAKRQAQNSALFNSALNFKIKWQAEFDRCKRLGIDPSDPLPHPDDIKLDGSTGEVRIVGPMDETAKEEWKQLQSLKCDILERLPIEKRLARRRPDLRQDLEKRPISGTAACQCDRLLLSR